MLSVGKKENNVIEEREVMSLCGIQMLIDEMHPEEKRGGRHQCTEREISRLLNVKPCLHGTSIMSGFQKVMIYPLISVEGQDFSPMNHHGEKA